MPLKSTDVALHESRWHLGLRMVAGLIAAADITLAGRTFRIPTTVASGEHLLLLSAAGGVCAMVVLEVLKRLVPIRGRFHRAEVETALGSNAFRAVEKALRFGDSDHIFDLPAEQVIAQLGAVAESELVQYAALIEPATPARRERQRAAPSDPKRKPPLEKIAPVLHALTVQTDAEGGATSAADPDELRATHETRLDALQITLTYRWRRAVRINACAISAAAATAGAAIAGDTAVTAALSAVSGFVLGGFVAWVLRDLVAVIEGLRR